MQRISQGDAARSRGTGSRAVPHRLNAEERRQYDLAKQKGVLTLAGSGYRRERECLGGAAAGATPCVVAIAAHVAHAARALRPAALQQARLRAPARRQTSACPLASPVWPAGKGSPLANIWRQW